MENSKRFIIHIGKVVVGLTFFLSLIVIVFFTVGFFYQDMSAEYIKQNGLFFLVMTTVVLMLAFPTWKWKKEILKDVGMFMIPF